MAQTVKERMLEDMRRNCNHRGVVTLSPEALAKRHGLNGHDLAKNLDQLRTEGFLTFAWSHDRITRIRLNRGAISTAALEQRQTLRATFTYPQRVIDYLMQKEQGPDGWIKVTTAEIVSDLANAGVTNENALRVAVSRLVHGGKLEARTETKRRAVVALRFPRPFGQQPKPAEPTPTEAPAPTMPATPELDKYVAARRIASLAPSDNPYLMVSFEPNPIAEEAMVLRHRLDAALKEK